MKGLNLKKTTSQQVPVESIVRMQQTLPNLERKSTNFLSRNSKRVPDILQSILREKASEKRSSKPQEEQNMKGSKLGLAMKSKIVDIISRKKDAINCQICEGEIKKTKTKNLEVFMCNCQHKFNFCQSCLHHYAIYKIKSFEEVLCPHQGCPQTLDTSTNFFKGLPADVQKNYKKIHQFYLTSNDPDLRLCPKENCQGIIKATTQNVVICNQCKQSFCSKCLLAVHEGECDNQEIKFFESNLHYRQCKKCKFIIQKNQGCNHMTCRCGNQFCYVCGADWASAHYGNHDQNGVLIAAPVPNVDVDQAHYNQNIQPCCDCQICDQCCGQSCAAICKFPFKIIFSVLLLLLCVLLFITRDLLVYIGLALVCIIVGLFGFSFQICCQLEGGTFLLGIIFFPFLMFAGVGVAFKDMFGEVAPFLCQMYQEILIGGMQSIWIM